MIVKRFCITGKYVYRTIWPYTYLLRICPYLFWIPCMKNKAIWNRIIENNSLICAWWSFTNFINEISIKIKFNSILLARIKLCTVLKYSLLWKLGLQIVMLSGTNEWQCKYWFDCWRIADPLEIKFWIKLNDCHQFQFKHTN